MHLCPWKIGTCRSRFEYQAQPQVMKWSYKPGMQQNRQQKVQGSGTKGTAAQEAPAQTKNQKTKLPESLPANPELQKPLHHDPASASHAAPQASQIPFGTMSPPPIRQSAAATRRKTLGPGEKQALAGGLFVMFCLALALAVGWWVTPAAPPSFSATDMHARDARPNVRPLDSDERGRDSYGGSGVTESAMDVEAEPVEEISVIPPAANRSPAAAQKKSNDPAAPSASASAASSTVAGASAKADNSTAAGREREVQRLKAEAYSETQKDRLGSSPPRKAAPEINDNKAQPSPTRDRAAQSKGTDLSRAVAECDNQVGLFYRERCKWRLCNGKWGKQGCPSFQNDTPATWQVGWLKGLGKYAVVNKKTRQISLSRFRIADKF